MFQLSCLLSAVLAALPASASREQEVVIAGRSGRSLAGTLTLPSTGTAPFPVAVSLTGSGLHYRDGNRRPEHPYRPFREIADALAERGVAMLRLDDRGVGGSTGDGNAATGDDIVFQGDRLAPVEAVLSVARRADRLVRQNFVLTFVYNLLTIPLAMAGQVTPLYAAIAMSGSSLLVIGNAMRLGRR